MERSLLRVRSQPWTPLRCRRRTVKLAGIVHTPIPKPAAPNGNASQPGWCFWIDRGGTFTDIVAVSPAGHWHTDKLLSVNPEQYVDAASEGVNRLLQRHGSAGDAVTEIRLGTTVATNALLEHAGAKVALVVTAGFADLPVIRQQDRPQLFHRELRRPAPLFACVIEATERVTHDGSVLVPLDTTASHSLQTALVAARKEGCEAVAICFLHGWAHPGHELLAAAAARAAGFTQVFSSHQVSPLPRWVPRADTTLADAYLTPVLQRYIQGFGERVAALAPTEVAFMQSHGGLTDAAGFRGVDALLSGPAGGLVGLQGVGRAAGYERLIGFDMGGTSTDVALIDGNLPRRPVNMLAGLTLQVPMLDIHTVAAGGGSVLRHTDGRLTAGPASAGAHPGPRCYRRGGPLAITDANVLLGRLLPERFPQVFGPAANEGLDVAAVRDAFAELADEVTANTAREVATVEASDDDVDHTAQLAEDFLAVAVGAMANAVRHVALRAGHDPEQFTLVCFGGAGGQHACQVAAALGMRRVLVHPLASVLSAVGIGLAPRRQVVRRGEGRNLAAVVAGGLAEAFAPLQQAPWPDTRWTRYLQLRLPGTDATLPVEWVAEEKLSVVGSTPHDATLTTTPDNATVCRLLAERFATLYRQRYGFQPAVEDLEAERLIVDALEVEAVADADRVLAAAPVLDRKVFAPATTRAWFDGAWHHTPVLDRAALVSGTVVAGPALVTDDGATTVITPGWQAIVLKHGELLLEPAQQLTAESVTASIAASIAVNPPSSTSAEDFGACSNRESDKDNEPPTPARLEIFNGLYMQVAEQMGLVLRDAARSVNVKERLDFSCAVFAADGSLVANAPHMPVHLGSMGASVRAVQGRLAERAQQVVEGDAWLVNVPWGGGTHLPDVTAVSPVLLAGETTPRFWVASRAHHADLGGITPGSMPPGSVCIEEEGIAFDGFQIMAAGIFLDAELRQQLAHSAWPARNPDQNVADVQAQLAANARGAAELRRLCAQHGTARVVAYLSHVQANAEAAVRQAIGALSPGECRVPLDAGMEIVVRISVDRTAGTACIDFTGTSAQDFPRPHNFHAPFAVTTAAVLYVFRTLIDRDLPLNEGCLRPLQIVVPEGCLLNPRAGAAVVAGNVETSQAVVDALYGALGLLAASQGTMNNFTFGDANHQYYETIAGGAGAGPGFAGASGIQTHMTNSRLTDPEILEQRFPVRLESFGFRHGSGGAGQWRGGDGLTRVVRFLAPLTGGLLSQRRVYAPFGLAGGGAALPGRALLRRADGTELLLDACATVEVEPGDVLQIETPGGGGYGKPA